MDHSSLRNKLEQDLANLEKIDGVEASLVVNNLGEVLYTNLKSKEVSLFGSMANIISNSSLKLLKHTRQGEGERILLESSQGKALFLTLKKGHLVVLTNANANIGAVMLSSKKAAFKINNIPEMKAEEVKMISKEKITSTTFNNDVGKNLAKSNVPISTISMEKEEISSSKPNKQQTELKLEKEILSESKEKWKTEQLKVRPDEREIDINETKIVEKQVAASEMEIIGEDLKKEIASKEDVNKVKDKEFTHDLPIIQPPITFPELPQEVEVPDELKERSDLIIDIYEYILRAMSIGASKIMGVAPARGMLKKSLPYKEFPELLAGVDVKNNSVIEFEKIRENLEKYPTENRSEKFIEDFNQLITAITDNYGKVMGYNAFRGMIRTEFGQIYNAFGPAMEELGIIKIIHSELKPLLSA